MTVAAEDRYNLCRGRRLGAWALLILSALSAALACGSPPPPVIPDPETAGMEGRVRQRIEAARQKVSEEPGSAEAWGKLGMICDVHELDAAALASYRQAAKLDAEDPRWPYFVGRLLAIQGQDLEAAIKALETAAALKPSYAAGQLRLADTLAQKGDLDAARAAYERALKLDGSLAKAHLGLGQTLLRQGQAEAAISPLEKARQLSAEDAAVFFALGQAYQRAGRVEAAREASEAARNLEIVDGFPDPRLAAISAQGASSSLLFERAAAYLRAGKAQEALEDLKVVASLRPSDPYVQRELGLAYQQLDQPGAAVTHLKKALELKPELGEWRLQLAEALLAQQDSREALAQLRRARELGASGPRLSALRGSALARSGDLEGADREFSTVEVAALPLQALFDWGNVLAQLGRLPEAEERFRSAIHKGPDFAPAHLSLGLALEAQRRPGEAIPHYRKAMELDPNPMAAQRLQALGAGPRG